MVCLMSLQFTLNSKKTEVILSNPNHSFPIKSNSVVTAAFVESVNNAIKARTTHYFALLIADTDYLREEVRYAKTNLKLF